MNSHTDCKLVIVEGLTGSGKSIMAHFLTRQYRYHGIPSDWVHEGEISHPILIDNESGIDAYMLEMLERWQSYVNMVQSSGVVKVVEASYFNNLIETLLIQNVERRSIIAYGEHLEVIIKPLNPTLLYLVQEDLESALKHNFDNRGEGFKNYVIQLVTQTPIARQNGWEGYDGMVMFWSEFISLTDELFQRFGLKKIKVDTSGGDWENYNRQVLQFLSIPVHNEPDVSVQEANKYVGIYKDRSGGKEFGVRYVDGKLTINVFLEVRTRLIPINNKFITEGWHFEINFEPEGVSAPSVMRIEGKDVDYLKLVGTVADRITFS